MATEGKTAVNTSGTEDAGDGVQQPSGTSSVQTSEPKESVNQGTTPEKKSFDEDAVAEKIKKARADEKSKVYSKLDEMKQAETKSQTKIAELEKALADTQSDLDNIRKGKASELESIAQELAKQRETNEKLNKAIEQVASDSADRIRESDLKAYREKVLRENKIQFTEQIVGDSEEAIDEAVKKTLEKEEKIREELRKEVRKEVADTLPEPLSLDGQHGRGPTPHVSASNREAIASLKGEAWVKERKRLLEEAKQKAGFTT